MKWGVSIGQWLGCGLIAVSLLWWAPGCKNDPIIPPDEAAALLNLPEGFDTPDFPADNVLTTARWTLGKKLFYDVSLSRDSSISCASCHDPSLAFTDGRPVSIGVNGAMVLRNSPTLANLAYQPYFMTEGGVATLEMQVGVPIQEHAEFDFNFVLLTERLSGDLNYQRMSQQAYNRDIDPFVISRAIASFERTFISGRSSFDQFQNENSSALTESQKRGMDLFFSERTSCSNCHGGFTFTNYSFQNNGLYIDYTDPGRERLTGLEEDRALFKVPTLRNISVTGPYMHDGSFNNLQQVVDHYRSGGEDHPNKSELIRPLDLTDSEASDLISFLEGLTDTEFLTDLKFRPE